MVQAADCLQLSELPIEQPDRLLLWAFFFQHELILVQVLAEAQQKSGVVDSPSPLSFFLSFSASSSLTPAARARRSSLT
ncbi:hypothetical protein SBA1_170053 [Candidatus Sulfotelmatobacter kueseliae]|uniref:Uncharacterized protein n=1 Tax=Candidatus Sulfotelmatobacter kueseliae TaxID=2042962 RepID=A0A2U3KB94_9BACT|nr:hypothetical protein SBA1_170053 [Candidatus Sulfotelmatobacter kueseliae]